MTGRSIPEWVGKTPDSKVPDRVRLRIFLACGGRCHLSGREIRPGDTWDLDHVVALTNGGEHREKNLRPALRDKHREKTAADVAERARVDERRASHVGSRNPPPRPLKGKPFAPAASAITREQRRAFQAEQEALRRKLVRSSLYVSGETP
jgi:hypothetical protein